MTTVRVLGVGSPLGDDAVGWRVIECWRQSNAFERLGQRVDLECVALDRPGVELIRYLRDTDLAVIIDAAVGDAVTDTIISLQPAALPSDSSALSAHGLGVASALRLAKALDVVGAEIVILGIPIDPPNIGAGISPQVEAAIPQILSRLEATIEARLETRRGGE